MDGGIDHRGGLGFAALNAGEHECSVHCVREGLGQVPT
jgi:hypothetical protein